MDQQKYQERVELFQNALHCKANKRVPTLSNAWGWKILDCDLKPSFQEATSNWDIMEKVVREHFERYNFDSTIDVGFRFNSSFQQVLGDRIRHDSSTEGQALDTNAMRDDEYELLTQLGPDRYEWEVLFPRMFGELTLGELEQLLGLYGAFGQFVGKMYGASVTDYSMPIVASTPIQTPVEELFNYYRGIKGLSTDMRRRPQQVLDYIESAKGETLDLAENCVKTPHDVCAFCIPFLAPTVLNKKQFEKFYWPTFKEVVEKAYNEKDTIYLFVEGETGRFAEYFNEFPETFMLHVEQDDIFEVRKQLPKTCLAGGMPVSDLNNATKEQCIDIAKKLCDELGNTGYVFSQNKMMAYANDGKRENLLAVQEFVNNYTL